MTGAAIHAIMLVAAIGLVITLCLAPSHSLDIGFRYRSFPFGFFRVAYSFFAGVLIYRRYASRRAAAISRTATFKACAVIAIIGALLLAHPPPGLKPLYDFAAVTLAFPLLIYIALWFQPTRACARICGFLGAISYAVYTLHAPLGDLVQGLLRAATSAPIEAYAPWSGLIFFLLLIPLCRAIDTIYDKPVRRRLLALKHPAEPLRPASAAPDTAIAS
jgi:peptidoglycan/LPS O-acetylase OafA/YrhL